MGNGRITDYAPPDEIIKSGYGRITHREWCNLEIERHRKHGANVYVKERKSDGHIALCRK